MDGWTDGTKKGVGNSRSFGPSVNKINNYKQNLDIIKEGNYVPATD